MESEIQFNCQFYDPVDLGASPKSDFEFSKMTCSGTSTELGVSVFDETIELIQNDDTGSEFYLEKSVDYGDLLISFFLIVFLLFGIFKFFIDFLIPKFMNFKRF